MPPRTPTHGRLPLPPAEPLCVVNPDAAGLDVHSDHQWVAVPPDRDPEPVRRCGACTCAREAIADGLARCHVTTIVRASTGVYWIPRFEGLERRGWRGRLLAPRQAQRASGRPKTDRDAGQGRQRLHAYGLLAGACRPDAPVGGLRRCLRPRQRLITSAGPHLPHRQNALGPMHGKRAAVVSAIPGQTGMRLLKAIVGGQRAPHRVAQFRARHGPHDAATRAKALQGHGREDHRFARRQALAR
jgi:transposase